MQTTLYGHYSDVALAFNIQAAASQHDDARRILSGER
jgi:hypothetical protein